MQLRFHHWGDGSARTRARPHRLLPPRYRFKIQPRSSGSTSDRFSRWHFYIWGKGAAKRAAAHPQGLLVGGSLIADESSGAWNVSLGKI